MRSFDEKKNQKPSENERKKASGHSTEQEDGANFDPPHVYALPPSLGQEAADWDELLTEFEVRYYRRLLPAAQNHPDMDEHVLTAFNIIKNVGTAFASWLKRIETTPPLTAAQVAMFKEEAQILKQHALYAFLDCETTIRPEPYDLLNSEDAQSQWVKDKSKGKPAPDIQVIASGRALSDLSWTQRTVWLSHFFHSVAAIKPGTGPLSFSEGAGKFYTDLKRLLGRPFVNAPPAGEENGIVTDITHFHRHATTVPLKPGYFNELISGLLPPNNVGPATKVGSFWLPGVMASNQRARQILDQRAAVPPPPAPEERRDADTTELPVIVRSYASSFLNETLSGLSLSREEKDNRYRQHMTAFEAAWFNDKAEDEKRALAVEQGMSVSGPETVVQWMREVDQEISGDKPTAAIQQDQFYVERLMGMVMNGDSETQRVDVSYTISGPSNTQQHVNAGDAIDNLINYRLYNTMGAILRKQVIRIVTALRVGRDVNYAQLLQAIQSRLFVLLARYKNNSEKVFELLLALWEINSQMTEYGVKPQDPPETLGTEVNPAEIETRLVPDTAHGRPHPGKHQTGYLFPSPQHSGNDFEGVTSAAEVERQVHNGTLFSDIVLKATKKINENRRNQFVKPSERDLQKMGEVEDYYYGNRNKIKINPNAEELKNREEFLLFRTLLHYTLLESHYVKDTTEYRDIQNKKQYAADIFVINSIGYQYLLKLDYDKLKMVADACKDVEPKLWPLYTSELARETAGKNIEDLYLINALIFHFISSNSMLSRLIPGEHFSQDTMKILRPINALKEYVEIDPISILPAKQNKTEPAGDVKSYLDFRKSTEFSEQSDYNHQFSNYINKYSREEAKAMTSEMALGAVSAIPIAAYTYGLSIHHNTGWLTTGNTENADVLPGRLGIVKFEDGRVHVTAFVQGELRQKQYSAEEVVNNPVLTAMSGKISAKVSVASNRFSRGKVGWKTVNTFRSDLVYKHLLDSLWGTFFASPVKDFSYPYAELVFNSGEHQLSIAGKNLTGIVEDILHLALVDTAHAAKQQLWLKSDGQKIAEDILPLYKTLYAEFTDDEHEMDWEEFVGEVFLLILQLAPTGIKLLRLPGKVLGQVRQVIRNFRSQGLQGRALLKSSMPSVMKIVGGAAAHTGGLVGRAAWEMVDPMPMDFMQLRVNKGPVSLINTQNTPNFGAALKKGALKRERGMKNIDKSLMKDGAVCWDGAVKFQFKAGLIKAGELAKFRQAKVRASNYIAFIGSEPKMIRSLDALSQISPGSRIGFIEVESSELKHAMILLDDHTAGGINNGYLGKSPGWTEIALADVLRWEPDGSIRLKSKGDDAKFILVAEGGSHTGSGIPGPVKQWTNEVSGFHKIERQDPVIKELEEDLIVVDNRQGVQGSGPQAPAAVKAGDIFGADARFFEITPNTGIYQLTSHGAHGNTGHFSGVNTAKHIRTLLDGRRITRLELKSCFGGYGGKFSNAQIISNELRIDVKAYTIRVSTDSQQRHPNAFTVRRPMDNAAAQAAVIAVNNRMFEVSEMLLRIRRRQFGNVRSARDDIETQLRNIASVQTQSLPDDEWLTRCFEAIVSNSLLLNQLGLSELREELSAPTITSADSDRDI